MHCVVVSNDLRNVLEYLPHTREVILQQQLSHCPPPYAVVCFGRPTVPPGRHHALVRAARRRDSHSTMQCVVVSKGLYYVELGCSRHDGEGAIQQQHSNCMLLYAVACCGRPTMPPHPHHALVRAAQRRNSHSTMHRVVVYKDLCDVLGYSPHGREATLQQHLSHCMLLYAAACCGRPTVPPVRHHALVRAA